ncbi:MAG: hypothetical protein HFG26_09535 [Provencibacterium sp.]|jgi:hypothetical protein|nr:hypothetical protein [Provencibacterium sp.]
MEKFRKLWKSCPWAVLFAVFILLYTGLDMTQTDRERSEMENRPLKTRPKLEWRVLMKGEYDERFDSYINDQFVGRDGWITLKSCVESLLGKTENNGVIYGKDGYLFVKLDRLDEERYQDNLRYTKEFFELYPELPVTFAITPNAYMILEDKVPYGVPLIDQAAFGAEIYELAPAHVSVLNLLEPLRAHKEEYIYYRTDHHWTVYGAYLAAQAYAQQKGMELPDFEIFEQNGRTIEGFYGTNYSKAKKVGTRPDTMLLPDIPMESVAVFGEEKPGLYDEEKLATRDKYAAYLWGNNNFTELKAENNRYPAADGHKTRVLLIKDSFGNSLAPFLTYLYDEVDIIDLRYVNKLSDYLRDAEYDDVLLLYNFESFVSDPYLSTLRY